jgi:hypothetical protein
MKLYQGVRLLMVISATFMPRGLMSKSWWPRVWMTFISTILAVWSALFNTQAAGRLLDKRRVKAGHRHHVDRRLAGRTGERV